MDELDDHAPEHFSFPESSWKLQWQAIPEFVEQYKLYNSLEGDAKSVRAEACHKQRRIEVPQAACDSVDPGLTIFGIESDIESWWEANTFHISGHSDSSSSAPDF